MSQFRNTLKFFQTKIDNSPTILPIYPDTTRSSVFFEKLKQINKSHNNNNNNNNKTTDNPPIVNKSSLKPTSTIINKPPSVLINKPTLPPATIVNKPSTTKVVNNTILSPNISSSVGSNNKNIPIIQKQQQEQKAKTNINDENNDEFKINSILQDLIQIYENQGYDHLQNLSKSSLTWSKRLQLKSMGFIFLTRDLSQCVNSCNNIVVIIESKIPKNDIASTLKYIIYFMETVINKSHEIIYFQTNTNMNWHSKVIIKLYDLLSKDSTTNHLDRLTIVNPTPLLKVSLSTFNIVFRSHSFIKKIQLCENLYELFKIYNQESLNLPSNVICSKEVSQTLSMPSAAVEA